jgi:hypothetical protein
MQRVNTIFTSSDGAKINKFLTGKNPSAKTGLPTTTDKKSNVLVAKPKSFMRVLRNVKDLYRTRQRKETNDRWKLSGGKHSWLQWYRLTQQSTLLYSSEVEK